MNKKYLKPGQSGKKLSIGPVSMGVKIPDGLVQKVQGKVIEKKDFSVLNADGTVPTTGLTKCGGCFKYKIPKDIPDREKIFDRKVHCKCGRPTDYTEEIIEKAKEYLAFTMPWTGDDGIQEMVHTIEGFSLYIGVTRDTVYDWVKDPLKAEFSYIVKQILSKQGKGLLGGGLSQKFSGSISKVMLTKHGYRDTVENFNREIPIDPEAKKKSDEAIDEFLSKEK